MAESFVQVPADDLGKQVRMESVDVSGSTRYQQVATLASSDGALIDGSNANGLEVDVTRLPNVTLDTATLAALETVSIGNFPATQPVSGTVAATQSGTWTEANSAAIKAAVETIDNAIAGSEMQVDVVTLPALPAGTNNIGSVDVASIAAGDNNIGNVDVVSLPALPTGTNNIGDVDVLSLPALPAGTNAIGKLAVNDGVDIGDVTLNNTSIAVTQSGTWDEVGINDSGNSITVDSPQLPAALAANGGLKIEGVASGVAVPVSVASVPSHAVTNIGTFAVQVSSLPASTNTLEVVGDVAHGGSNAGNPVKTGNRARTIDIGAATNDLILDSISDKTGRTLVAPYAIPENYISGLTAAITGTSDTAVIASPGASIKNYITQVLVTNSHATVGTVVELKSATTVLYRGYAAPAGGGFALTFPVPLVCAANEAFNAANVTTGSNTYVSATGYRGA